MIPTQIVRMSSASPVAFTGSPLQAAVTWTEGTHFDPQNPTKIIVPESGQYLVIVQAVVTNPMTGTIGVRGYVDDTQKSHFIPGSPYPGKAGATNSAWFTEIMDLAAGEKLSFAAEVFSGDANGATMTGAEANIFSVQLDANDIVPTSIVPVAALSAAPADMYTAEYVTATGNLYFPFDNLGVLEWVKVNQAAGVVGEDTDDYASLLLSDGTQDHGLELRYDKIHGKSQIFSQGNEPLEIYVNGNLAVSISDGVVSFPRPYGSLEIGDGTVAPQLVIQAYDYDYRLIIEQDGAGFRIRSENWTGPLQFGHGNSQVDLSIYGDITVHGDINAEELSDIYPADITALNLYSANGITVDADQVLVVGADGLLTAADANSFVIKPTLTQYTNSQTYPASALTVTTTPTEVLSIASADGQGLALFQAFVQTENEFYITLQEWNGASWDDLEQSPVFKGVASPGRLPLTVPLVIPTAGQQYRIMAKCLNGQVTFEPFLDTLGMLTLRSALILLRMG